MVSEFEKREEDFRKSFVEFSQKFAELEEVFEEISSQLVLSKSCTKEQFVSDITCFLKIIQQEAQTLSRLQERKDSTPILFPKQAKNQNEERGGVELIKRRIEYLKKKREKLEQVKKMRKREAQEQGIFEIK